MIHASRSAVSELSVIGSERRVQPSIHQAFTCSVTGFPPSSQKVKSLNQIGLATKLQTHH